MCITTCVSNKIWHIFLFSINHFCPWYTQPHHAFLGIRISDNSERGTRCQSSAWLYDVHFVVFTGPIFTATLCLLRYTPSIHFHCTGCYHANGNGAVSLHWRKVPEHSPVYSCVARSHTASNTSSDMHRTRFAVQSWPLLQET